MVVKGRAIVPADYLLLSREVKGRWEQFKDSALNKTKDLIREPIETNFATKGETPLHIAVAYDDLKFLQSLIRKTKTIHGATKWVEEALGTRNEDGNTPLHLAASMGNVGMCECIAEVNRSLLRIRNNAGETPLFSAALQGKKEAFLLLHDVVALDGRKGALPYGYRRTIDGDTILHCAIAGEYFGLRVEELKPNDSVQQSRTSQIPGNDRKAGFNFIGLLINFLRQVVNFFKKHVEADAEFDTENPTSKLVGYRKGTTANIREEKEKHVWACQIMNILLSSEKTYEQNSGACPLQKSDFDNYEKDSDVPNIPEDDHTIFSGKRTIQVTNERPFFVAARHGITEMVQKILESDSMAADYVNQDRKNILLLAIENRLTDVLEIVLKKYSQRPSGLMAVDDKGNSALHLAARSCRRKILLGLTALYVSIASTLTSFCSAHYFVLKAKLKHAASPLYIATCLVVTLFAIAQFPLYFELVWATFKKVPERRSRRKIPEYLIF